MQSFKALQYFVLSVYLFALVSCATTHLPSFDARGKSYLLEEDEKKLWKNSEQLERILDKSSILYKDQNLEDYLEVVAKKLLKQDDEKQTYNLRIKVVKYPFLNAFALPHGVIYIHTGILACMDNEAQLATILGHEIIHFTHRHTLKEIRDAQNKENSILVLQTILSVAGTAFGVGGQFAGLSDQAGAIWALASIRGYSRELENEADRGGLRLMIKAGYDPEEAVKVFEHLQRELDEQKIKEPFFLGTHPRVQERINNYRGLLEKENKVQRKEEIRLKNSEEFLSQTEQLQLDNAVLDIQIGRLKTARAAIEKVIQRRPHCAHAYFLLGEVHRWTGKSEADTQLAITAYREAARLEPTYADPHREIGLLYRAQRRREEACAELELYLLLAPKSIDANIIRGYLVEMEKW